MHSPPLLRYPGVHLRTFYAHRIAHLTPRFRGVAVLGALLVMSILVALAVRSDRPPVLARHDTRLDVSARIPTMWHTQTFDNDLGLATHTGFVLSNVPHRFDYPDLGGGRSTSAWDMSAVPPHAVVLELGRVVRLAGACNAEPWDEPVTDFPLSLDDADMIKSGPRFGSPPRLYHPDLSHQWKSLRRERLVLPRSICS